MTKVFVSKHVVEIADEGTQVHDRFGYITDYPADHYYRNACAPQIYEGTFEIQKHIIIDEDCN